MIVLDSTFLIQIMRQDQHALRLLKVLDTMTLATTVINQFELYLGFFMNKRLSMDEERRQTVKKRLDGLFSKLIILPYQSREALTSAQILGQLMQRGRDIGDKDAMIAGIMLENGCKTIITSNVNHFQRVEGLVVVDQRLEPNKVLELILRFG